MNTHLKKYSGQYKNTVQNECACEYGRIEERQLQVLDAKVLEGLVDLSQWDSLNSIIS